jgi:hypothetical protein
MGETKPFGNRTIASILIIGHDPRLQHSRAEAETAFYLDYLARPRPNRGSETRKYELAQALLNYVSDLAGRRLAVESLFVTNLCNEFLDRPAVAGTILIPDEYARRGVERIAEHVTHGEFRLIVPMAHQTFYNLCRLGFVDERSDLVQSFVQQSTPRATAASLGIYQPTTAGAFLSVCGQLFHHRATPIVPILHVKQWPLRSTAIRYTQPMQRASELIRETLSAWLHDDQPLPLAHKYAAIPKGRAFLVR